MRGAIALAATVAAAALVAGCGSGSSYGTSSSASGTASGGALTVSSSAGIGKVLVDGQGHTLYMFAADSKNRSNCSGACAKAWPPASPASAGSGVPKGRVKAIARSDGSRQLSFAGHPLYRFSGDQAAGDANGQGLNEFGGRWNAITAAGTPSTSTSSSSSPSSAGRSYGGY